MYGGERFTAPRESAMRQKKQAWVVAVALAMAVGSFGAANGQTANMRPPLFHHIHLNSVDPEAALAFYAAQFTTTSKAHWAGFPALKSPNDMMVLFTKVVAPPTIV